MTGLDTTWLVDLEVRESPRHSGALKLFQSWRDERTSLLAVFYHVFPEFMHIVTDLRRFEHPLTMKASLDRVAFRTEQDRVRILYPSEASFKQAQLWLSTWNLERKRLIDTHLAAAYAEAGVDRLLTANPLDSPSSRFSICPNTDRLCGSARLPRLPAPRYPNGMKLFILSDIHGSVSAFRAAEEAFRREKADLLVLLGDYLSHGPRNSLPDDYAPDRLAPLLNAYKDRVIAVRGNCDGEVDQMLLEFPLLGDYALIFADGRRCLATHGHGYGPDNLPPEGSIEVLLSGHTHVPRLEERNGLLLVNPGSPSIPKGGSSGGYAVLNENRAELKTLDGETFKSLTPGLTLSPRSS